MVTDDEPGSERVAGLEYAYDLLRRGGGPGAIAQVLNGIDTKALRRIAPLRE